MNAVHERVLLSNENSKADFDLLDGRSSPFSPHIDLTNFAAKYFGARLFPIVRKNGLSITLFCRAGSACILHMPQPSPVLSCLPRNQLFCGETTVHKKSTVCSLHHELVYFQQKR